MRFLTPLPPVLPSGCRPETAASQQGNSRAGLEKDEPLREKRYQAKEGYRFQASGKDLMPVA
jgi:hypothetical protein